MNGLLGASAVDRSPQPLRLRKVRFMPSDREDPLVRSSRREALVVAAIMLIAMTYTLVYCGFNAYGREAGEIEIVLGFPDWVFWGVLAPWGICTVVSIVFAMGIMSDDPLGEPAENWNPEGAEAPPAEEPSRHV